MKKGTKYLDVDPWRIVEKGFHKDQSKVSESIFSLSNEYLGVRGYFEEGYTGKTLLGSYINGIYEYDRKPKPQYRGITASTNFMLNCDNWLYMRLWLDNEQLDLGNSNISNFRRVLDMSTGELKRSFIWKLNSGVRAKVIISRLLSNMDERVAYQHIEIETDQTCVLKMKSGIDFNTFHGKYSKSFWNEEDKFKLNNGLGIICGTKTTNQYLGSFFQYKVNCDSEVLVQDDDRNKYTGVQLETKLNRNVQFSFDKVIFHEKETGGNILTSKRIISEIKNIVFTTFSNQIKIESQFWKKQWDKYDIKIQGDKKNQQGIRFCIFQLLQTYRGISPHDNIGAKGLTGEVYNGHCYWETETIVLPFYLFTNIKAAKQLLDYRYRTLNQAKKRARMIDCKGASYPLATLNGEEGNDYWQHANTQLQPSTAVAYAIWHYTNVTGDHSFEISKGIEMLIEISRFLISRGDYGQESGKFGFYGVMGPDEFQLMVNHDAYTNLMGKFTFNYTIRLLKEIRTSNPVEYSNLCKKMSLNIGEISEWKKAADNMMVYKNTTGLIEQQQGYFDLPHIDISKISQNEFPLYDHWSYDRLFRNDMIKQPDVLMYMFLFLTNFSKKSKRTNYDYYNKRTVHESSLSPSIHSIIAEELGYREDALKFFEFATRLDLDNYNNNTDAGLHMTSISAAWLNIIYGFGGLRSDGDVLELSPKLPDLWKGYSFKINYKNELIEVVRMEDKLTISLKGNSPIKLKVFGNKITLSSNNNYEQYMKGEETIG